MPLFEYRCEYCNHVTEVLQNQRTDAVDCEACGSIATIIPSLTGPMTFLGEGFYKRTITNKECHGQLDQWRREGLLPKDWKDESEK